MEPNKQPKWRVSVGVLFLGVLIIAWIASISKAPRSAEELARPAPVAIQRKSVGIEGHLSGGGERIPVAVDETAFNEWIKTRTANDKMGQVELLTSGRVFSVPTNTRVLVIDIGFVKSKVRILEGESIGRSGWVPFEWVQ